MQLNPARGRKLASVPDTIVSTIASVYAAQPREGTETYASVACMKLCCLVYAAQPREGTETKFLAHTATASIRGLCSSTPRGDGNYDIHLRTFAPRRSAGLCSSTPRGDGNLRRYSVIDANCLVWFMQLNPARGRKLCGARTAIKCYSHGLCSSTPRGDGNVSAHYAHTFRDHFAVYAAQPREGTETATSH